MTELAEKSANGTLMNEDRNALQKEMDQLCGEIDRIATTTNFNGQKLLDGSIGSNGYVKLEASEGGTTGGAQVTKFGTAGTIKAEFTGGADGDKGVKITAYTSAGVTLGAADNATAGIKLQIGESSTEADKLEVKINSFHTDSLFAGIAGFKNKTSDDTDTAAAAEGAIKKNTDNSTYRAAISIDISDQDAASAAADAIRQVSSYVSDERGKLGAQQNRLEHTVNNLTTASENTTAAKSRILDTDMAKEMMAYTSKNVIA
jgi:flagellin